MNQKGILSFITPSAILNQNYSEPLRNEILDKYFIRQIVDLSSYYVFKDATVKTAILILSKENIKQTQIYKGKSEQEFLEDFIEINQEEYKSFPSSRFETSRFKSKLQIKNNIEKNSLLFSEICLVAYGVRVNNKLDKTKPKSYYIHEYNTESIYKPFLEGKNIERYGHKREGFLDYRPDEHYNSMFSELFENEKLMFINVVSDRLRFTYDEEGLYNSHTVINCVKISHLKNATHRSARNAISSSNLEISSKYSLKFLLTILNSNLINWYFLNFQSEGLHFYPGHAQNLPIRKTNQESQQPFIEKADQMLSLNKELQVVTDKFIRTLERRFEIDKLSKKLESWHDLSFAQFVKELKKKKVKLSLAEEAEWEDYFTTEQTKAETLKTQITKTDHEIDQMVYDLYGLTEEEIAIVENS